MAKSVTKLRQQYPNIDYIWFNKADGKTKEEKITEINDFIEQIEGKRYNPSTLYRSFKADKLDCKLKEKQDLEEKLDNITEDNLEDIQSILVKNVKLNELSFEKLKTLLLEDQLKPTELSILFNNTSNNINTLKSLMLKNKDKNSEDNDININILNGDIAKVDLFKKDEFDTMDNLFLENKNEVKIGDKKDE